MGRKDVVGQDETAGHGALAVIASPSLQDCGELEAHLVAEGLSARTVTSPEALLENVLAMHPDVLLVDLSIAAAYAGTLGGIVAEHAHLTGLPVILLLPEGGGGTLPAGLAPYVSDVVFRPVRPAELLHRLTAAIARRRRHQEQRASSARLREDMRRISARIRATNDPVVMVDQFLPAVGRALGAHHLALQVFDDDRVAARSSTWSSGEGTARASLAGPSHLQQDSALTLALKLWEDSATAGFRAGPAADPDAAPEAGDIRTPGWLLDAVGRERTVSGVVAALGEGDTPFGLLWIIREGTPLVWSSVEGALTHHVLGNLAHGLIQAQLISRQQQAVRKLRALNQAKSDFVGTVNHELRTPLASIAGYLEMIIDGVGGELPPEASTMLHAVERNTTKLSELIENISALSSRETDASDYGPVDIVHLVSQLTSRAVLEASAGGLTLDCTLPDHAITVSGDRDQLSAAIAIVLSNAIKFTQEDGSVAVGLTLDPGHGHVVVLVRDTGIGIPPDDLPHLFDSFHRAANSNQVLPGAGVGLSVARKTFEAHHGTITVESRLGAGTAVAITLPLLNPAAVG
ncbi:ATP-binding protein [Arthrobacter sp. TmT3-37]